VDAPDVAATDRITLAHARTTTPAATLEHVSKVFGSTVAVADVSFELHAGEVLALVGENGAGKSTCVKMLGGLYRPDGGRILISGDEVVLPTPLDAAHHGVAVVHQHPGLFPDLSAAENIFAGQPLRNRLGLLDHGRMLAEARRLLALLGLERDASTVVGDLRVSEQQIVEIARALGSNAKVLVLDEPTAALTTGEVDRLFGVIDTLRKQGVAMLFVGHRLEEIFRVSDRITVLRDGALVDQLVTADASQEQVVRLMVGRSLGDLYGKHQSILGDVVLETLDLSSRGRFGDVSLNVRAGEVVGMAGLVGSGRTEIARAIFGIERPSSGQILLAGAPVRVRSAAQAVSLGIAYVSEDRRGQSIVEDFSILENATLPSIDRTTRWGMLRRSAEIALVSAPLERMKLKFSDYLQPMRTLSGGNQQKVVLAKWLATNPRLLILDEPTQGIDIQAKAEVHRIIAELSAQGIAILLISSDMPELLGVCDRIYVMNHGALVAEFTGDAMNQFDIGLAATGVSLKGTPDSVLPATEAMRQADQGTARRTARPVSASAPAGALRHALARREMGLLAALTLIIVPLSLLNTNFYSVVNLRDLANYSSLFIIAGLGQMLVILTRNIDISVASTLGLSAYLAAATMRAVPDASIFLGIAVALATGLICGMLNGLVVAYAGVPSIVVTLGTLAVYRGVLSVVSSGDRVKPEDVSIAWRSWATVSVFGVSVIVLSATVLCATAAMWLYRTSAGRETYFAGSNPEGAELIGIPAKRRVLAAFSIAGVLAGATGALWASYYPYVDGQVAYGVELAVIAAVVVGGVALRGGSGTVLGVVIGTVGLLAVRKVLTISGVPDQYLQAVYGAAIILAVSVDVLFTTRAKTKRMHT
jgi:rhamnose transport system ATP-binding protein